MNVSVIKLSFHVAIVGLYYSLSGEHWLMIFFLDLAK